MPMSFRAMAFGIALIATASLAFAILRRFRIRKRVPGRASRAAGAKSNPRTAWLVAASMTAVTAAMSQLLIPGDWSGLSQLILFAAILFALALEDWISLTVDSRIIVIGLCLRLASLAILLPEQLRPMLVGMLCGAGLLLLIGTFYRTLRGRDGLGEGDAAVMGLIGAFVGWQGLFPALAIAALSGLAVALPVFALHRKPMTTAIPFVPFLALGGLVVYGLQQWYGWFWPAPERAIGWLLSLPGAAQ